MGKVSFNSLPPPLVTANWKLVLMLKVKILSSFCLPLWYRTINHNDRCIAMLIKSLPGKIRKTNKTQKQSISELAHRCVKNEKVCPCSGSRNSIRTSTNFFAAKDAIRLSSNHNCDDNCQHPCSIAVCDCEHSTSEMEIYIPHPWHSYWCSNLIQGNDGEIEF